MRVMICDDDLITRRGLSALLTEEGHEIVAEVADADAAIAAVERHAPKVAILDIRMPPSHTTEGLAAARAIRATHPHVALLVLSHHLEPAYAMDLIATGSAGMGYLLKERVVEDHVLADAVRRVAAGECVIDPIIVQRLMSSTRSGDPLAALSAREREVLALVAEGRSNRAIAAALYVAERTVESHTAQIFLKLHIDDEPDSNRRVRAVLAFLRSPIGRSEQQ